MDRATAAQQLTDYLSGYSRGNPGRLAEVAAYDAWQARAKAELDRRMTRLMEALPDDLVAAVAVGEVDLNEVARRAIMGRLLGAPVSTL